MKHTTSTDPPKTSGNQTSKSHKIKISILIGILILIIVAALALYFTQKTADAAATVAPTDHYAGLIGDAPTIGPANAKVTVIVYSDLFCPHCLVMDAALEPVLEKYKGKVRMASVPVNVLWNMGYTSTHAAYCAREQGKYWQMHKKLFGLVRQFVGQPKSRKLFNDMQAAAAKVTPESTTKIAATIPGIDTGKFLSCMKSNRYADKIKKTSEKFTKLGFQGVPTVLINGIFYNGYPTEAGLSQAIDNALHEGE